MLAGREDHMTKLGKTKPISVEKHLMSMVVLKKNTSGMVLKNTIFEVS